MKKKKKEAVSSKHTPCLLETYATRSPVSRVFSTIRHAAGHACHYCELINAHSKQAG